MHTTENQSVGDIRSNAVDKKRATNTKHKWHPRWESAVLPSTKLVDGKNRPRKLESTHRQRSSEPQHHKAKINRKQDPLHDDNDPRYESSSDESFSSHSTIPDVEGIEEVTFSYDAPTGPSKGSDVLGAALSKAVERFEDRQTALLVQDEYDVLSNVAEEDGGDLGDDDDYEMV